MNLYMIIKRIYVNNGKLICVYKSCENTCFGESDTVIHYSSDSNED
jgi:hypothetical protein